MMFRPRFLPSWIAAALLVATTAAHAQDSAAPVSRQLLDAGKGTPLSGARVVFVKAPPPPWNPKAGPSVMLPPDLLGDPPPSPAPGTPGLYPMGTPSFGQRLQCDAQGFVRIPADVSEAMACVLHEQGMAWLAPEDWKRGENAPTLQVTLQPWSSLEGRVLRSGQPVAGATIAVHRGTAFLGAMSGPALPLQHIATAVTDKDGRFSFPRLLAADVDGGPEIPYDVNQRLTWKRPPELDTMLSVRQGTLTLRPGQHVSIELEALAQCMRQVSARFVWADGQPVVPSRDLPKQSPVPGIPPRTPAPSLLPKLSVGISMSGYPSPIQEDGRFTTILPLPGEWRLSLPGQKFLGGSGEFTFTLPPSADGGTEGAPIDLGDIVLQREGVEIPGPPPADAEGNAEVTLRVIGEDRKTLTNVSARIKLLESKTKSGSRPHHPGNPPAPKVDKDGLISFFVPISQRTEATDDEPAKLWDITHVTVELASPGYEPLSTSIGLTAQGTVLSLKRVGSGSVRVTLDGQPVSHSRLHLESAWESPAYMFAHLKWAEKEGVITHATIPPGVWQVQAAHIADDGWRWFSQITKLGDAKLAGTVHDLPLQRGTRLAGRIAAEVPRPVENGFVRVVVFMPESSTPGQRRLRWSDWQPIATDGTFEFKGLPTGEAWITASCKGWISVEP